MFYREAGEFKTSYEDDQATFPIAFDRWRYYVIVALAFLVVPFLINPYWEQAIFLPFFVFAMAALGLNILTGYCGQVSLGTGGFMAVGAYACYKLMTGFEWMPMPVIVLLSGVCAAGVGILFGLPSLRIKGFYLAVATLAAQFFLIWMFNKFPWFYNYSATGQINAPERSFMGVLVTGPNTSPWATYLFCLSFVFIFAWVARNLTRGRIGRSWMAIRDMDIAAEIIGVNPLMAKLSAFAISSFYIGMAGAMYFAIWKGAAEGTEAFSIEISFLVLFMVILGGLGSIFGSLVGAAFLTLLPVLFKNILVGQFDWPTDIAAHLEIILIGGLIIFFLIKEPHGIAALTRIIKEKLRLWPFPH
ncbi:branched-chain amino acid ABC transporter permease [Limibaculum sp. M0105]|uniref:Branched-chain amino acid ABC transporter permease n=1 Tax=Thermohalobaculum xanthum TaxID=2753746 RepID=A0A8J7SEZ3_9RHOB|nr:branched-chain amino acid ABC transporter permease [Thermohalobaculum xanthum]MBK0399237.1 branched-chain amino acid ABC transporter permease [Thermohalobaculum xanthum]